MFSPHQFSFFVSGVRRHTLSPAIPGTGCLLLKRHFFGGVEVAALGFYLNPHASRTFFICSIDHFHSLDVCISMCVCLYPPLFRPRATQTTACLLFLLAMHFISPYQSHFISPKSCKNLDTIIGNRYDMYLSITLKISKSNPSLFVFVSESLLP